MITGHEMGVAQRAATEATGSAREGKVADSLRASFEVSRNCSVKRSTEARNASFGIALARHFRDICRLASPDRGYKRAKLSPLNSQATKIATSKSATEAGSTAPRTPTLALQASIAFSREKTPRSASLRLSQRMGCNPNSPTLPRRASLPVSRQRTRLAVFERATRMQLTNMLSVSATILCALASGCAALTNPVANSIPVRRLPTEFLAVIPRESKQTIPLTLLRQEVPDVYRLAAGDVLGIFIDNVLPSTSAQQSMSDPPVYFPSQVDPLGVGLSPALGFPISIGSHGKIVLPLVDPVPVSGLSIEEASEAIRKAYLDAEILQPGRERVLVTLMEPRRTRVMVFRQELGGFAAGGRGDITTSTLKRGTGHIVDLRAYENDVLHALAATGGLPGLDAFDDITIFKGGQADAELTSMLESLANGDTAVTLEDLKAPTVRIPTRRGPGEPLLFHREDVILESGDIVFVEARTGEFFYTGGLLPPAQHELPRDYDLDVVQAVTLAGGSLLGGAFQGNNLSGGQLQEGIGNPSPSLLTVLRRTPGGGQIPIRVDLNRAVKDPRERILVQTGDILILQETPGEALARYVSQVFNLTIITRIIQRGSTDGVTSVSIP